MGGHGAVRRCPCRPGCAGSGLAAAVCARPAACSHALAPDEVLAVRAAAAPPPAFLLSLGGVAFELGGAV